MITKLKRTPITWNGEDGWEILIRNVDPFLGDVCQLCMYRDWNDWEDCEASCDIVHHCHLSRYTYFIFKKS